MGQNKKSAFTEEELLEIKQENQHEELILLLGQVVEASKDDEKLKEIGKAIQNNAIQIGRFVDAFKSIKFEVPAPQVNLPAPQVNVDVNQGEVVRSLAEMFTEMKTFLIENKIATEKLSRDVIAMNESYRADKIMTVSYYSGMLDQITVKIKK